jgi:2-C-methyl-D-erythritol 2,4-cyclodiphosphate synthase
MATGLGFDIHRLVAGRRLMLGGVAFDHPSGLLGHSDGDVILHAVTDALLGAIGKGDIGDRFPDTDPRWKDAASEVFLRQAMQEATDAWDIENIDITVVAEEPKLGARKRDIARSVAKIVRVDHERVSVKAKTAEGLGPIGHREAIACLAVVSLQKRPLGQ